MFGINQSTDDYNRTKAIMIRKYLNFNNGISSVRREKSLCSTSITQMYEAEQNDRWNLNKYIQ